MWEDLSESYGLEYLQGYSPSSSGNSSGIQPCLLEPQPCLHSLRQPVPLPRNESGVGRRKQVQIAAYKMTIKLMEKLIGWGYS